MLNQNELYRDFLDRKFDEVLQAIQAISPVNRAKTDNNEVQDNARTK